MNEPTIQYHSPRLIGLELEYDYGSGELRIPELPSGWCQKADGSLHNGREFIIDPPVQFSDLSGTVKQFSDAFDQVRMGLTKRGGFHVHVQVRDYTHQDAFMLAKIYCHFQPVINQLVAKSRVSNTYCRPLELTSLMAFEADWQLNSSASSRASAKGARRMHVINFAMMRCTTASHRTVEFRQGSPSKRFTNIYGWASFVAALTDLAKRDTAETFLNNEVSLAGLIQMIETVSPSLAQWVVWRHEFMNPAAAVIDRNLIVALVDFLRRPHGLFGIASKLKINYPTVNRLVEVAASEGLISRTPGDKWVSSTITTEQSLQVLSQLEAAANAREHPVTAGSPLSPVPAGQD